MTEGCGTGSTGGTGWTGCQSVAGIEAILAELTNQHSLFFSRTCDLLDLLLNALPSGYPKVGGLQSNAPLDGCWIKVFLWCSGVGGIEAEAVMLGQPISMVLPEVVGYKLHGTPDTLITSTDIVLTVTKVITVF